MKFKNNGLNSIDLRMQIYNFKNQNNQRIYEINAKTAIEFSCVLFARSLQVGGNNPICEHMDRCQIPGRDKIISDIGQGKTIHQAWLLYQSLARTLERRSPGNFMRIMAPGIHDLCKSSSYFNAELVTAFYEYVLESIKY